MYWTPLAVGLSTLALVSGSQERAIGDVLAGAPVDGVMVSADNVVQCGQATVTWAGTTGPVSLMVGTGGFYANLQPIQTIDNLSGSSTTVEIDQKEGTDLIFKITDSQNKVGYVQNIKVGGGDDSCLSSSSAASSAASSEASSSSSSTAEASSAGDSSSEAAPVVAASSSAETPSPSSSSNNNNNNGNSDNGSSSVQPTQSPSSSGAAAAAASPSSAASSVSAAASASGSSVSAAAASAVTSARSSPSASSVAAASNTNPNGASGMSIPGWTAVLGLGIGVVALF